MHIYMLERISLRIARLNHPSCPDQLLRFEDATSGRRKLSTLTRLTS